MFTCCNICRSIVTITSVIALTLFSQLAYAAQILVQTGDPQLPGVVTSTWRNEAGDAVHDFMIPAQSRMSAADLTSTLAITVRAVAGEPYERIIGYELGPVPEPVLANPYELDPDSIPF